MSRYGEAYQEVDSASEDASKRELEGQGSQALCNEEGGVVIEAVANFPPQQWLLGIPASTPGIQNYSDPDDLAQAWQNSTAWVG